MRGAKERVTAPFTRAKTSKETRVMEKSPIEQHKKVKTQACRSISSTQAVDGQAAKGNLATAEGCPTHEVRKSVR